MIPHLLAFLAFVHMTNASNEENCAVPTDADVLGLGIRLGLYLQLSSNLLLYNVRRSEVIGFVTVSNMLLTGFFIAIIYSVVQDPFPPGALISVLWLQYLDVGVLWPILMSTDIVISVWTYAVCVLRADGATVIYLWF